MSVLANLLVSACNNARLVTYPCPSSSMLGGVADFVQTMYFWMSQPSSSSPSSSQSWSPLHTREWLTHFPESSKNEQIDNSVFMFVQWFSVITGVRKSFISNLNDNEICPHIPPLGGRLLWFHTTWSQTALHNRNSLQTERRRPWLDFLSITNHDVTKKYERKILSSKQTAEYLYQWKN